MNNTGDTALEPLHPALRALRAALAGLQAEGRLPITAEDERAAAAMIRLSSNEATACLMGRVSRGACDTTAFKDRSLTRCWTRRRQPPIRPLGSN